MRNKSVGVGIIGFDHWYWAYSAAYSVMVNPKARLVGIWDENEEEAKKLAARYKAAEVAEAMDPAVKLLSFREKAEKCSELVERLLKDINCIVRFGDFGLKEEDIEKVTHIALTGYYFDINSHPKQVTPEDIKRIYREYI